MDVVDLYLRKSNKDDRRSVGRQETDLVAEAASAGLTIGRTFIDPDLSASRFARKDRPDYLALLAHIRSGQCRVVGIVESSRGSRNNTEWNQFLDLCRDNKIRIWVQTHDRIYDPSKRRDWAILAQDGVQSADESNLISERTLSGKRAGAAAGRPAGRAIYGHLRVYDDRGKLTGVVEHPDQAPIVREMVNRIIKGDSLHYIAQDLNRRGVCSPGGGLWRNVTVRQTVMRPAHVGKRVHHGQVTGDAMWDGIVDERQWNRAIAIITRPERRSQRGTALVYWLSGAVLCGVCREERLRPGTRGRYTCRRCYGLSVSVKTLEKVVEAALLIRASKDDGAQVFTQPVNSVDLQAAEDELKDLEVRLEAHYAEAAAGALSARGLSAVEARLLPEIERAKKLVTKLSIPAALAEFEGRDILTEWPDMVPTQRRKFARALVDLVVMPATKKGPVFDVTRLDESRWIGDEMTWGQRRTR